MKYLHKIDYPKGKGYRVLIYRDYQEVYKRWFSVSQYGSWEKARKAAIRDRRQAIARIGHYIPEGYRQKFKRTPKGFTIGVKLDINIKGDTAYFSWEATWLEDGRVRSCCRSISYHGYERAYTLAMEARAKATGCPVGKCPPWRNTRREILRRLGPGWEMPE